MTYQVIKATYGSSRWHVCDADKALLLKCDTKRTATALAAFAAEPNAQTYSALFASTKSNADFCVFAAFRCGVGPTRCNADPKTGVPITT